MLDIGFTKLLLIAGIAALAIFVIAIGVWNCPASSIQLRPVSSPLPLSTAMPAAQAPPGFDRPRGRIAVTPVRTTTGSSAMIVS